MAARATGPWGGALLQRVRADLAKGWPPGLTVLTGDDLYHLDRAQRLILEHLVPDPAGSFGLSIVGDESIATGSLVGAARSLGMFAARRVVFLRDVAALEGDPEPLAAYAAAPPRESYVVVRAPKLDRKRKLHKTLAEAGACLSFRAPEGSAELRELASEVAAMARDARLGLGGDAAALLVDVCGTDLNRIAAEIEKMSVWLGAGGGAVGLAEVRALVAGGSLLSGWELAGAVTVRDTAAAIEAARRLVDAGVEPIQLLGGVAFRTRALLKAKAMAGSAPPGKDVVDAVRAWYFRDDLAKGLKRYALPELLALPAKLYEADRTFKSRGIDKGAVLETLVVGITGAGAERR